MTKLLVVLLLICQVAWARELTVEQKTNDLNELIGQIKSGYGPLVYKKVNYGIDVDALKAKYLPLVQASSNNTEFYYLMVKFVAEFNDSHFGASLPTDLESSLGFSTDLVEGKVVIDEVDRNVLALDKFDFAKGDEIISIGGKPVMEELGELTQYMGQGYVLSAKRRAASMLSTRRGSKVPVKTGKVVVEIRRGNSRVIEKAELEWKVKGRGLDVVFQKSKLATVPSLDYDKIEVEDKFRCSPTTRIKIPQNATIIMKEPFVAYYYPTEKGNVGYLRIPHYSPTETDSRIDAHALRFKQYEYAVSILEKNTVGLIIDQDHNCGGSVDWLHRFLSLFMDRPFQTMQFELLASKASVLEFEKWMAGVNQSTLDYQNVLVVRDLILETWQNSNDYLTRKTPIGSAPLWNPNPVHYTKPIIVLIDELSGSGGDAFPAMIQGFGRAKLLGTRTMGAGGHVIELPSLGNSQIKLRMTKSLFYRPDGVAVENNGATPDIPYTHTLNDFKYGYQEYQSFYTEELLKML